MAASRLLRTLILLALVELAGAVDPVMLVPPGSATPGSAIGADDGDARLRQLATNMGEADDRCKAVAVSGLNGQSCQMTENDKEKLGKLSVRLLNCQRALEGRSVFECSMGMTLQQCTQSMDETIWGSYMQVQRAALGVCLQFQQSRWQRETADTVRALTETATSARSTMEELRHGQAELGDMNREVLDAANRHHRAQMEQHGELKEVAAGMLTDVHSLALQQTTLIERNDALVASSTLARDQFTAFHDEMSGKMDDYKSRLQTIYAAIEAVLSVEQSILQQFFDTAAVVFYVAAVALCYLMTTPAETRGCRLMLFLLLALNLFVECAVSRHGIATAADPGPMVEEDHGRATGEQIWFVRKLFTSMCCLLLSGAAWLYEDLGVANKVALSTLLTQNSQILAALAHHGIRVPSTATAAPAGAGSFDAGASASGGGDGGIGAAGAAVGALGQTANAGLGAIGAPSLPRFRLVQRGACVVMEAAG